MGQRALGIVVRQVVRLRIIAILQAVLDHAQEHVCVEDPAAAAPAAGRDTQCGERRQGAAKTKRRLAPTAHQLQRLTMNPISRMPPGRA
jgi:hypothetical protein